MSVVVWHLAAKMSASGSGEGNVDEELRPEDVDAIEREAQQHQGEFMTSTPSSIDLALLPGVDPTLSLSPEGTFDPLTALNQYQRDKYDRLREAVNALDLDDRERYWASPACLLRYLRARQWKVAKALPMFKDTIEWRRSFRPEDLRPEDFYEEADTGKNYLNGWSLRGQPCLIMTPARENYKDWQRGVRLSVFNLERALQEMDESRGVESLILIVDNSNFSMKNSPPLKISRQVLNIVSNHYPERLGKAIMLFAPWVFSFFWNLIKPFINKVTSSKIVFLSGKTDPKSKLYHALEAIFDMKTVENRFGGSSNFEYNHEEFWAETTKRFYQRREEQNAAFEEWMAKGGQWP